ncbi:hypothetical protein [Xanthomonas albilineans]|uniref:hypothetical protein n=1 Tax=Xanthomonas albilineans TaxID=29447 RepID=UPI0005F3104C|nr:hypothetical protein [Xanthomonas albilineans]PPU93932.1 hypothetical protein XalbCFBP2523_05755 [Xanthomonas albilineans]
MKKRKSTVFLRTLVYAALLFPFMASADNVALVDFYLSKEDNTKIDMPLTIESDAGDGASVRWSYVFIPYSKGKSGRSTTGYIGLQRNKGMKQVEYGIYNASNATAGSGATTATLDGTGKNISMNFDWKSNNQYVLRIEKDQDKHNDGLQWWKASIIDASSKSSISLGSIGIDENMKNITSIITGTSYSLDNKANCETTPYARARFDRPQSDDGKGKVETVDPWTISFNESPCALMKKSGAINGVNVGVRSDTVENSAVQQIGLSQGPQKWGWFDNEGTVGSIFKTDDSKARYFQLLTPTYWYYPSGDSSNESWKYLGTTEPFYNGPAFHNWSENDRRGKPGDLYAYFIRPGTTYYFIRKTPENQQHGYFPTTPSDNDDWHYVGTNINTYTPN